MSPISHFSPFPSLRSSLPREREIPFLCCYVKKVGRRTTEREREREGCLPSSPFSPCISLSLTSRSDFLPLSLSNSSRRISPIGQTPPPLQSFKRSKIIILLSTRFRTLLFLAVLAFGPSSSSSSPSHAIKTFSRACPSILLTIFSPPLPHRQPTATPRERRDDSKLNFGCRVTSLPREPKGSRLSGGRFARKRGNLQGDDNNPSPTQPQRARGFAASENLLDIL